MTSFRIVHCVHKSKLGDGDLEKKLTNESDVLCKFIHYLFTKLCYLFFE